MDVTEDRVFAQVERAGREVNLKSAAAQIETIRVSHSFRGRELFPTRRHAGPRAEWRGLRIRDEQKRK
jgi:hypothetical protein